MLVDRIAGFMHAHTLYWYYRPFGCSALIGTNDDDGAELYQVRGSRCARVRCGAGEMVFGMFTCS